MGGEYIPFSRIKDALPAVLDGWREADLIKIGRQSGSPLKFIRTSNRTSPPLWRRDDLIAFFTRRYGKSAPELVEEFVLRLNGPSERTKKAKRS